MKHYFLGAAAGYSRKERLAHTFAIGREKDRKGLVHYLGKRYGGGAILCKNGRSALALALKAYFKPGDAVLVNGFTCYAVFEAVKAAGLVPIFADISREDLNFDISTLGARIGCFESVCDNGGNRRSEPRDDGREQGGSKSTQVRVKGIIVQNTLGNPIDIAAVEKFAKKHSLTIIEDLAHCAGVKYADGREAGTVGAATALSFGKDKSIDTTSGGAVILRDPSKNTIKAPSKVPKISDHLRARFYPLFGAMYQGLSYVHLHGVLMRFLLAVHWVERSADNKLDLERKISKFEAKLALRQLKKLKKTGEPPLREFYLVDNRGAVLKELARAGYFLGGFWYEKPVSPERYYKKVHFPAGECPNAVYVSEHIVNLPTYYSKRDLAKAREIIGKHLIKEADDR